MATNGKRRDRPVFYEEGTSDDTIDGLVIMWEDTADVIRPTSAATPLPIEIVTDSAGIGGGTEYTEGAVDATISGTAIMWEDSGDTLRAVSAANPLPIDITDSTVAVTQSGTWTLGANSGVDIGDVTVNNASLAVTNAGTFAVQEDGAALTALQLIDNPVTTISATDVMRVAIFDAADSQITSFGGGTQYTEGGTDATITGTAVMWEDTADTLRAASAAKPLPVEIITGGGSGGTAATDDAAFTAGSGSGTPAMGFFSTDTVDANDVGVLAMDASRRLLVSLEVDNVGIGGGTQYTLGTATFAEATTVGTTAGVVRKDSAASLVDTDNELTALQVDSSGALRVTGGGGGTEYNEDVATPATITGTATLMERDDALTTVTPIEGDWIGFRGTAEGALWVQDFNSDAILADTTAILADTANMDTNLGTVAGAVAGSEMQVDIVANATDFATQTTLASILAGQLADGHNVTVDNATLAVTQSGTWTLGANSGTDIGDVTINNAGHDNLVSTNNSTSSTLLANTDYTGTGEDVSAYTSVTLTLDASHDSDADGIRVEFSTDNTNWDDVYTFTYTAADGARRFQFPVTAQYYRVVYQNAGTNQTHFRLQSILHRSNVLTSVHRLVDDMSPDRSAQVVKTALFAQVSGSGDFTAVASNASGKLQVAADVVGENTPADAYSTPTDALDVGAFNMVYNGTTWDLVREGATAGSILVDGSNVTQPVSGTVTANAGTGTFTVDGSGVTQPISAASLPLPSGAATAANQLPDGHNVTIDNAAGASAVNIQDGGNSITVDGTVTETNSAAILADTAAMDTNLATIAGDTTSLDGKDFATQTTLATMLTQSQFTTTLGAVALVRSEDAGSTGGASVMPAGVVRDDTLAANAEVTLDGDYTWLRVDNYGALWTTLTNAAGAGISPATEGGNLATIAGDTTSLDGKVNSGGGAEAGAVRVTLSDTGPGVDSSLLVDLGANNDVTVTGTVTANLSATDNAVLDTIETNTDFGTVTGGGTQAGALRVTVASDSTGVISVDDNAGSLTVDNATLTTLATQLVAHDAADAGNPLKVGAKAIDYGTNPTEVAANDRTDLYANRAGVLHVIGGHPNTLTASINVTDADGAQSNAAIVSTTEKIAVTAIQVTADNANTGDCACRIGFGATTTPANDAAGLVINHQGIAPGSGIVVGDGSGIIGIGAAGEDLRITCEDPAGGNLDVVVTYFTIAA